MDEEALLNGTDTATGPEIQVEHHNAEAGPSTPALSKNAQKRAARLAKQEAQKPIKRAAERERRRVRAAQLKEGYLNGTLSPEELAIVEGRKVKEQLRKSTKKRFTAAGEVRAGDNPGSEEDGTPRRKKVAKAPWDGAVLIDMGFDDLMFDQASLIPCLMWRSHPVTLTRQEIKSMASQISYCYASNRQAKIPVRNVIHTSASHASSPRLWPPLEKAPCERWIGCHWFGGHLEEYLKVFQTGRETGTSDEAAVSAPAGIDASTHKLVYLSADAEEELDTLREDEVYIIGGIVDRNRYKNLCQNKAEKLEIRTARLPIGAYIDNLPTRKVLTVNQVFQILTEYIDKRDWKAAFEAVIPIRKYSQIGRRKQKKLAVPEGAADGDADGDDDDDEEAEEAEEAKETSAEISGAADTQSHHE